LSGLFSKPKIPQPIPTRMPVSESEASRAAKALAAESLRRRAGSGRSGTDLEGDYLGQ
jgi:hypothetical protein